MKKRYIWILILSFFLVLNLADNSWAEYPDRPITMIGIMAPGGGADLSTRALSDAAAKILGQPIIVQNKVGASGALGTGLVAAAKPDGYTIGNTYYSLMAYVPNTIDVPYNPLTDFEYILGYGRYVYGLAVRKDSPFKTLKDLVQYARANPGKIKYSLTGLGLPNHFGMVRIGQAEGVQFDPIIFKESSAAVTACLGGHVDAVSQNPGDVMPFIESGELRLLVSFSTNRWDGVPDVPTVKDLGYKFVLDSYLALGTPKGVPLPILNKLRDAFKKSMDDPAFKDVMTKVRVPVAYTPADDFKKFVETGVKENEALFKQLGLHKSQLKK